MQHSGKAVLIPPTPKVFPVYEFSVDIPAEILLSTVGSEITINQFTAQHNANK